MLMCEPFGIVMVLVLNGLEDCLVLKIGLGSTLCTRKGLLSDPENILVIILKLMLKNLRTGCLIKKLVETVIEFKYLLVMSLLGMELGKKDILFHLFHLFLCDVIHCPSCGKPFKS